MKHTYAGSVNEFHVEVEANKKILRCFAGHFGGGVLSCPEAANIVFVFSILFSTPVVPPWVLSISELMLSPSQRG